MEWLFGKSEEPKPKGQEVKITVPKMGELPKLKPVEFKAPAKPTFEKKKIEMPEFATTSIGASSDLNKKALKNPYRVEDLADYSSYKGRFRAESQRTSLRMAFIGEERIKVATDEHFKFLARNEAAKNIGSHVYLTDEEIKKVRENA